MSIKFKLTELIKSSLQKLNIETDNIVIEKPAKKENNAIFNIVFLFLFDIESSINIVSIVYSFSNISVFSFIVILYPCFLANFAIADRVFK